MCIERGRAPSALYLLSLSLPLSLAPRGRYLIHALTITSFLPSFLPWLLVFGSWAVWVPAHTVNFAFIPPAQRLLYINTIQIFYNIFLSFLGNKKVETPKPQDQ